MAVVPSILMYVMDWNKEVFFHQYYSLVKLTDWYILSVCISLISVSLALASWFTFTLLLLDELIDRLSLQGKLQKWLKLAPGMDYFWTLSSQRQCAWLSSKQIGNQQHHDNLNNVLIYFLSYSTYLPFVCH